jgi:hypothetical protein
MVDWAPSPSSLGVETPYTMPSVVGGDDGLQSPTQLALVREAICQSVSPKIGPVGLTPPPMHAKLHGTYATNSPSPLSDALSGASAISSLHGTHLHAPDGRVRPGETAARSMSGGVHAMAHVPTWMMNPALGGFNPLPPRQALHMSVCSKYTRKRDEPEHFTEALVLQAEHMIANDKNFFRRGSVSGWKIKPVTAARTKSAVGRVGGVRPKSSWVPSGAGFFFDQAADTGPATPSSPESQAQSRMRTAKSRPLLSQLRSTSLPADGMLPAADFAATHRVSTPVTRSLSQSTSYNFLTRPSRQRRKLPLEDLVPKSHAALAARPPAWLEPFAHRASVKKAEESLTWHVHRDAIGSDLYLQHMNDRHFMQIQNDAMRVLPERSTRTTRLV